MLDRIRRLVAARFGGRDDGSDSRFVPSPLDTSVRVGHGGPDDEIERELTEIDERARELEEARRE